MSQETWVASRSWGQPSADKKQGVLVLQPKGNEFHRQPNEQEMNAPPDPPERNTALLTP